jgi:hypothetical protein
LKKLARLMGIFGFLLIVNLVLIHKINAETRKNDKITILLDEFTHLQNLPSTSNVNVLGEYTADPVNDPRVASLKGFFRKYDSPLYDKSEFIVATADKYGMDYRLIPAISMQESGACKVIPPGSHNCWGWGIYGNQIKRFNSYEEAIEAVSKGLKTNYIDKGRTTPDEIMKVYTPGSNGSWAFGVNTFLKVLE